jgi:pimeloyl-ACP methyl ester carboxylesterase
LPAVEAIPAATRQAVRRGRRTCLRAGLAAAAALALPGCGLMRRPVTLPMGTLRFAGPCRGLAPVLLVMLPGAYSDPREFVDEGYVEAVRSRGLAADVVIADAHLGYFEDRSVFVRLREDVLQPARAAGYRQVWLVGISLGGFAALGVAARRIAPVDGIVALAPYLGQRTLLKAIDDAGGPLAWAGRNPPRAGTDELDADIWRWLATRPAEPPVFLGAGRSDRFADAHRTMATLLPAERVREAEGGHDWPAWRALWNGWLDRRLLPAACPGGA